MSTNTWLWTAGGRLRDLAFPPTCAACAGEIDRAGETPCSLCSGCFEQLAMIDWATCRRCAARVPEIPGPIDECGLCQDERIWFDRTFALGSCEGLLHELLSLMKHDRKEVLALTFADLFDKRLGSELRNLRADAIVPIPQNIWRRLDRQTNPPSAMAKLLGKQLRLPVASGLLHVDPNTGPQRGLSQPGRKRNIRGALRVLPGYPLKSTHVLLLDDVMTTGATCSEAARVLKRQGVKEVTALVVGRTSLN